MLNGRFENLRIDTSGPVDGDRPHRDVDAGTVRQPRVDHGRGLIDPPADGGDDPVDDAQKMRFVAEIDLRLLEPAGPFDEAALVRVDQDVRDRRILQQRLDRSVAGHFVDDFVGEEVELLLIERQTFAARVVPDIDADLPGQFVRRQFVERREVELVDDLLVQLELDLDEIGTARNQFGIDVFRPRLRRLFDSQRRRSLRRRILRRRRILAREKTHVVTLRRQPRIATMIQKCEPVG